MCRYVEYKDEKLEQPFFGQKRPGHYKFFKWFTDVF